MQSSGVGRLLRACLTGDAWRRSSPAVAQAAVSVDPPALALAAEYHGVPGYVRAALTAAGTGDALLAAVQPAYHRGLFTHLRTLGDLLFVDEVLRPIGVPYVVLKGPVLATQTHPRQDLRAYGDLDVLVPPPHFGLAVEALIEAGAVPTTSAWSALREVCAGEVGLVLPSGGSLDLHWHTINSPAVRDAFRVDPVAMVERSVTTGIGDVQVQVLDDADALVYVAMHTVLSGAHRLVWTKDVDQLLVTFSAPWDEVVRRARSARASLVVSVALMHARSTLGTPLPRGVLRRLGPLPAWSALFVLATRASRPESVSAPHPMMSRVVARSTRQGLPSSVFELARRARAAQRPPDIKPSARAADADEARSRAEFTRWADSQLQR